MKLEEHHRRPLELLQIAERDLPGCWERTDGFREARGKSLPDWPAWCYLPIAAGFSVATEGADPVAVMMNETLKYRGATFGPPIVALAAWRATQGVWEYDPDLYEALWETPAEGELPVDLLYRLPEWAPYICLRNARFADQQVVGVIPWLEWDANGGPPELRLLLDLAGAKSLADLPALSLHLDASTIEECLQGAADQAIRVGAPGSSLLEQVKIRTTYGGNADLVRHVLSLVLYLCSQEPDLTRRMPPSPTTYRRPVLRPPQQPIVWPVGLRIGAALRAAQGARGEPGDPTGRFVRAHMRRAHWHCYWVGPRTERSRGERLELRWVAPTAVGAGVPVATVHEVK
jgi:hypothetical protein